MLLRVTEHVLDCSLDFGVGRRPALGRHRVLALDYRCGDRIQSLLDEGLERCLVAQLRQHGRMADDTRLLVQRPFPSPPSDAALRNAGSAPDAVHRFRFEIATRNVRE